ncbi:hypothetical protein ACS0TY_031925 [Phlomoides rotata]
MPKQTLGELIQTQRNFLWGGCDNNSKIPWVKWENICREKSDGGLGIWRFLNEPGRLWVRVIKARYGGFVCSSLGAAVGVVAVGGIWFLAGGKKLVTYTLGRMGWDGNEE